jgi:hypothetical protein
VAFGSSPNGCSRAGNTTTSAAWSLEGETRQAVAKMVREYDPTWQSVVVIPEQDDSIHAYKVALVGPIQS